MLSDHGFASRFDSRGSTSSRGELALDKRRARLFFVDDIVDDRFVASRSRLVIKARRSRFRRYVDATVTIVFAVGDMMSAAVPCRGARTYPTCVICSNEPGVTARASRIESADKKVLWPPGNPEGIYAHQRCVIRVKRDLRVSPLDGFATVIVVDSSLVNRTQLILHPRFERRKVREHPGREANLPNIMQFFSEADGPALNHAARLEPAVEPATPSLSSSRPRPILMDYSPLADPSIRGDSSKSMRLYDFALLEPTLDSDNASLQLQELVITIGEEQHQTEKIAGGVTMYDCPRLASFKKNKVLQRILHDVAIASGKKVGVDLSDYELISEKLLKVDRGGEQIEHWDTSKAWDAVDSFAMILNCSEEETHTTAVPRFSAPEVFNFKEEDGRRREPTQTELQARAHLLDPEWYHRTRWSRGEVMFFRQSIPHKGTKNSSSKTRIVFFCLLVKKTDVSAKRQADANQYFRWMFVHHAFSSLSNPYPRQYARALLEDADEQPVERFVDEDTRSEARECLAKWGMLQAYEAVVTAKKKRDEVAAQEADIRREISERLARRQPKTTKAASSSARPAISKAPKKHRN